jgi:hypothetical protein
VLIARDDISTIRVIQGLLSVFRILPVKGELKLNTITDPFSGISTTLNWEKVASLWTSHFLPLRGTNPIGRSFLLNLKTSGPNYKTSILGAGMDAKIFQIRPDMQESLTTLSRYFNSDLHHLLKQEIEFISDIALSKDRELFFGRLSTKVEAAGKVRVFAIVDV